ncbi:MAG TPA: DUF2066 domain-containing protein [Pseudomonadales bacterium]|nr:DUF2066 domain-containing protein [Pseudomonadales bacterium]
MKIVFTVLIYCVLLCSSAARAARLEDPYTIEVPVASQSATDRPAAERAGLLLVLERLSGQPLDGDPRIKSALTKSENYLLQFTYVQDKPAASGWRIKLGFSPAPVNQLLNEAGVALWPLDRPLVMLLMVNEQAALLPLPASGDTGVASSLMSIGQARGVPLLIPDPAEQDITVAANVQALDAIALLPLATQKKADALLLGNVRGNDTSGWSGQWSLHFKDQDLPFQQKAATFPVLVDAALRQTAAYLSGSYLNSTTADTGPAQLRLQVDGVKTYAAYMQLRQYLEKLEAVQRIASTQISGTTVMVDVDVKGRESFRNLTALFKSLQWKEELLPTGGDPSSRPVWHYDWIE